MALVRHDLLNQVTGTNDVFLVPTPYLNGSLQIGYNGQLYSRNVNVAEEVSDFSFRLSWVPDPECTTSLHVFYDDLSNSNSAVSMQASGMHPNC